METLKSIAKRKSTRSFDASKPISKSDINTILTAGCAAPIGAGDYKSLHLTAIQDSIAMDSIVKAAQQAMHMDDNPLYNATAFVVVSASIEQKAPHIEIANAACIIQNMMLAATDLGIDSVYIWGVTAGTAANRELWGKLGIPEGYSPVSGVALGYGTQSDSQEREFVISLSANYV